MTEAIIVGAGPAGLMAAEVLAKGGVQVRVMDAMPSVGRKFLMAGKSGLNLTKMESAESFLAAFGPIPEQMTAALQAFGPDAVAEWAVGLGQDVFTGSTGRLFPKAMKASPLLRAWLQRLDQTGVQFLPRWRWTGWDGDALTFDTPQGPETTSAPIVIIATGGASWARLGSDGAWANWMPTVPFKPANMGFLVDWSAHMTRHFGTPVKGGELRAGKARSRGEWIVSANGIEGGGVYMVSRAVREGAAVSIDLLPDRSISQIRAALIRPRGKTSLTNHLRKTLRLDPIKLALLSEFGRPFPEDISPLIKSLLVKHAGPRPIDEAISTAGGVPFDALHGFALKSRPGTYVVGEALDWEAPTGGYLITGCLASAVAAARQALSGSQR